MIGQGRENRDEDGRISLAEQDRIRLWLDNMVFF